MNKSTLLRQLIEGPQLEFIMEAHNGLSAKIVEEAGFKGIWASGLSISAALGVRDNNEASWTQVLEVCEFMSDATGIPILLDGDTGFGNFNSFRRLVTKLEQRNIGGVCIEDKVFPKTNSFIGGEKQPLAEIDEFCGKIKSGKDAQTNSDFVIIARVEAFIAGWGLDEALKRASAYADAGADAILMHSKIADDSEIRSFMEKWDGRKPVVIVPTMYYQTKTDHFRDYGVALVIWANHSLRASITNVQRVVKQIYEDQSLQAIENTIVPVKEVFRLQNVKEYQEAEELYLPKRRTFKGLILAASKGANFGSLTDDKPKAMIKIGDDTILSRIVKTFHERRIKDISVVVGFKKEKVDLANLKYITNEHFHEYRLLYSLYSAVDTFSGDMILSFGDIVFEEEILRKLTDNEEDIVLAVDATELGRLEKEKDLVKASAPYSDKFGASSCCRVNEIVEVVKDKSSKEYNGEFMGLIKLSDDGSQIFQKELLALAEADSQLLHNGSLNDFINYLINKGYPIHLEYFKGHWQDIDSIEDLTYMINLYGKGHSQ